MPILYIYVFTTLSPIIHGQPVENGEFYLKGNDPIGDTPIFHWLPMDYGRKY